MWQTYLGTDVNLPTIDFTDRMVVMVAMGVTQSSGASVDISTIEELQDSLLISVQYEDQSVVDDDSG